MSIDQDKFNLTMAESQVALIAAGQAFLLTTRQ